MRSALLAAVTAVLLCSIPALGAAEVGLVAFEGKVIISGNAPFLSVVLVSGSRRFTAAGPLVEELRHLQEVSLRVVGRRKGEATSGVDAILEVIAYAPVGDGFGNSPRILVGLLVQQGQEWLIADLGSARLYQLTGKLPARLEGTAGAKVLVRGRSVKGTITPLGFVAESFQVIAPAGRYRLPEG